MFMYLLSFPLQAGFFMTYKNQEHYKNYKNKKTFLKTLFMEINTEKLSKSNSCSSLVSQSGRKARVAWA